MTTVPDLAMSSGVKRRDGIRPSSLLNMYLEVDEASPDGFARVGRDGMVISRSNGGGPIRRLFVKRGVFNSELFTLSGSTLYRDSMPLGDIPGQGFPSMSAGRAELLVTRGETSFSYDGSDLTSSGVKDDNDNAYNVRAHAYLGGYFIAVRDGTNRFYWSASQDGRTWDGFDFAAAESSPDQLLDAYVVNDSLWLMGEETVEAWQLTGNVDAPFARVEGILLKKGIIATGCAAELDNSLFWWGHDGRIYRAGQGVPQRVSDDDIEACLIGSAEKAVFAFTAWGHDFLCVRTDSGTFVLDISLTQPVWSEYGSYNRANWRVQTATPAGDALLLGDDETGDIWTFDASNFDDGDHLERRFSASFGLAGGVASVRSLGLISNAGETPVLTGQGVSPVVAMRSSRDAGRTWGVWRHASLGAVGRYRERTEKRRWGIYDKAGGLFEFRVTDPVPFRATRAYANEPSGGRSSKA